MLERHKRLNFLRKCSLLLLITVLLVQQVILYTKKEVGDAWNKT